MGSLNDALDRASYTDFGVFRPVLFRTRDGADRVRLLDLVLGDHRISVHDSLLSQLCELMRVRNPGTRFAPAELEAAAVEHLNGTPIRDYGVWVYYPWSHRLVHILDEAEFTLVRTDRNRNKITWDEQATLASKKVGVIGLSVGQSISLTMALERSFGEIRLADHDNLELSNLNRIRSGLHELGDLKVINTAREIAELDPFLQVSCFPEGITRDSIDRFLTEGGKLDLLVEVCDSVDVKLYARQRARDLGIPVIMDTSDRGMLDIERFDLEPDRPILHGLVDHLDIDAAAKARTAEEKLPFILPIAGVADLSKRMKASMLEVENSIVTWPQLASSVVHGAAVGAEHYRRIVLGEGIPSGRWYLENDLTNTGSPLGPPPKERSKAPTRTLSDPSLAEFVPRCQEQMGGQALTLDQARRICEAGMMAPSAGNMQPWRFLFKDGVIHLFHAFAPDRLAMNAGGMISGIDMACCLENMVLKAAGLGIRLDIDLFPEPSDPQYVGMLSAAGSDGEVVFDELVEQIPKRTTNRHRYDGIPIPVTVLQDIGMAAAGITGCHAHFVTDPSGIGGVADLVGRAEQLRMLDPVGHRELFEREIRWTQEEAERTRDGLDLDSFELKATDRVGLSVAADPDAIAWLREWGAGSGFQAFSRDPIRSSSAVMLITTATDDAVGRISGGRALQRSWLAATRHGLAAHPIAAPILLAHHAKHTDPKDQASPSLEEMTLLGERIERIFKTVGRYPVFMLRLGYAPPPSSIALRRPLSSSFHRVEKVMA